MIKKILFYIFAVILLVVLQGYVCPCFFLIGLFLVVWFSWEAREIYVFLVAPLIIDLASSLPFGFFALISWVFFFFTFWVQKNIFRHWSFWTKYLWFLVGQALYLFFFLWLSQSLFFAWFLKSVFASALSAVVLLFVFEKIKLLLEREEILTRQRKVQIEV